MLARYCQFLLVLVRGDAFSLSDVVFEILSELDSVSVLATTEHS